MVAGNKEAPSIRAVGAAPTVDSEATSAERLSGTTVSAS